MESSEETEISKRIEQLENFHKEHKISFMPPLVVFCGTIEDVKQCFVLINGYRHKFSHILQAVQFCFKSFKAFQLDFPELCKAAWSFIQRRIYKINLNRGISCVDELVRKLVALETTKKRKDLSSNLSTKKIKV